MRFYLISDNVDTMVGMRLAGIDGVLVHEKTETEKAILSAMEMEDVAIILITPRLIELCSTLVFDLKLNRQHPLIVEIPDRHGTPGGRDNITRYIREAVGIKI